MCLGINGVTCHLRHNLGTPCPGQFNAGCCHPWAWKGTKLIIIIKCGGTWNQIVGIWKGSIQELVTMSGRHGKQPEPKPANQHKLTVKTCGKSGCCKRGVWAKGSQENPPTQQPRHGKGRQKAGLGKGVGNQNTGRYGKFKSPGKSWDQSGTRQEMEPRRGLGTTGKNVPGCWESNSQSVRQAELNVLPVRQTQAPVPTTKGIAFSSFSCCQLSSSPPEFPSSLSLSPLNRDSRMIITNG